MSVQEEYAAFQARAVHWVRDDHALWQVQGPQAASALNGLLTNDVARLRPGEGAFAAALTPKGKVLATCQVLRLDPDTVLTDVGTRGASGDAWRELLRKYVNPRFAAYTNVSAQLGVLRVVGPHASSVVAALVGAPDSALPSQPYAHTVFAPAVGELRILRNPSFGVDAFDVYAAPALLPTCAEGLVSAGSRAATMETRERIRIEAGLAEAGVDIDDATLVQEANLDLRGAVSFDKGCYTGQEVVARLHFRGHANRFLRGVRAVGALRAGMNLRDADGRPMGDVRSVIPTGDGRAIGLAMVRREIEPPATVVTDEGVVVEVVSLPPQRDTQPERTAE